MPHEAVEYFKAPQHCKQTPHLQEKGKIWITLKGTEIESQGKQGCFLFKHYKAANDYQEKLTFQ